MLYLSAKVPVYVESTPIKIYIAVLLLLIVHFQYRIWIGDGSLQQIAQYDQRLDKLKQQIQAKRERNDGLYAELSDLRKGQDAIEERARYELGMIQSNETFFQVIQ